MSKPINSQTQMQPQVPAQPTAPKKVKIGGVEFDSKHVKSSESYVKDGKKMNCVFLESGVQIDYPDQTDSNKNPKVRCLGIRDEWYNPNDAHTDIYDLDNATIYGAKNQNDYIDLCGKSTNNTIIVDQKESWYINKDMRKDTVYLGSETSNNNVKMDASDKLEIGYTHPTAEQGQSPYEFLKVEGEGYSEQEVQLKHDLGDKGYQYHKFRQNNPSIFNN